jgi:(p)ppGpp synthase/HD superfamily hydrolase
VTSTETPATKPALPLGPRFVEALAYAARVHEGQPRKGTEVPYVSHVLGVCAIVLEEGGGEDEAIAALLHDAVEDGGGLPVLEDIRRRFGERVADIVLACTDTDETPKPPWKRRKEHYIAHLRTAGRDSRRVSCADKLYNARSILRDYRNEREELWNRFNASSDEVLWYYRELVEVFRPDGTPLARELERVVGQIEVERQKVLDGSRTSPAGPGGGR